MSLQGLNIKRMIKLYEFKHNNFHDKSFISKIYKTISN